MGHMPTFVCNARYFLVTYAQCGELDPWAVNDHFAQLGAECIIGREDHSDGGNHLHAFVDFGRKFRSRRSNVFDVDGRHPNIEPSKRSPQGGYDYAIKDGNVVAGGLARPSVDGVVSAGDKWSEIVGAEDEQSFWAAVERLDPKALCTQYGNLRKFADWRYKPEPEVYEHPEGLDFELGMVPQLVEWGEQLLGRRRSLCIYGPTRVGKTTWARSLGMHVYFIGVLSGEVALRDMPTAQYAIFDDIRGGIKFFPSWKEWFGCQMTVSVKKLYRDPVQVCWGKPCIWLSNADPRTGMEPDDIDWLEGNCDFIYLEDSIVRANSTSPEG
uniref:Replication-associated protein n=1 Tax=Myotis capaccinii feces associated gemycircularvirus TaxID=3139979 RepID=A0AAU6S5B1_9VIRU